MPGTDPAAPGRTALVRQLTIAGWLVTLLRLITGIAIAMFLIGVVSIISILLRDNTGPSEIDDAFLRIGGMSLAAGIVVLCRTAEKYQPAI